MPYIKSADWCRIQQQLRKPESEDFSDLKLAIAEDAQNYSANDIANTLLNDVCVKLNCREEAFVMEKGESVRVQPFRLTDGTYKVVSRSMLTRILEETQIDAIAWQAESRDCEDIARDFVSRCVQLGINSVGRVCSWSGTHAFNIAIVQEGDGVEFVFIEPQTDEIITILEGKYDLSNALIIIS